MCGYHLIGTEKKANKNILARKQPGRWFWWEGNNNLEGFYPSFFSFLLTFFHSFKHPTPENGGGFFFSLCATRGSQNRFILLFLWVFRGPQSSPTLPTYLHTTIHLKPQQKKWDRVSTPTWLHVAYCIFFWLFFLFLFLFFSFLSTDLFWSCFWENGAGGRTGGAPRISFLFLVCSIAYHIYLGEHNFYLLCVSIIYILDWGTIWRESHYDRFEETGREGSGYSTNFFFFFLWLREGMGFCPRDSLDQNIDKCTFHRLYFSWGADTTEKSRRVNL